MLTNIHICTSTPSTPSIPQIALQCSDSSNKNPPTNNDRHSQPNLLESRQNAAVEVEGMCVVNGAGVLSVEGEILHLLRRLLDRRPFDAEIEIWHINLSHGSDSRIDDKSVQRSELFGWFEEARLRAAPRIRLKLF